MVRDFTEATKERLSKEIDDINKKTWNPVTDFIGDIFMYGGKWLGILSLNEDMSNVESYQRRVLDMTDMTKKELKKIFEDVYAVDKDYKGRFSTLNEREKIYNSKLQILYSMLKPNFSICDAKKIKSMVSDYNAQLKSVDGKINKDFEAELDWAAKQAALENTKGLFGGVLKTVIDVVTLPVSMVKNVATGNWGGIFTDTWSLVDDVFAVGSNLVGLTSLGLGYGISALTGSNETKNLAISYGEAFGGASGLTDALEADQKVNGENQVTSLFLKGSKFMDNASAAVGLFSTAKGFLDEPSKMIEIGFEKYKPLKKVKMLEKYQDNYHHWQSVYRHLWNDNHYGTMKNISHVYEYLENIWELPNGGWNAVKEGGKKTAFNRMKWFKVWGDAYDFGEDVYDFGSEIYEAVAH